MTSYKHIQRSYGVTPRVGQRITVDGRPGTILRPKCEVHYLRVRFDGHAHASNCHPTWRWTTTPSIALPQK